jgi:molybdenum cofactor biosynthesis enzyme MoaA
MGVVTGLGKIRISVEVDALEEDQFTENDVARAVWRALSELSKAVYSEVKVTKVQITKEP